ncbi:ATP-binding protein [Telmatobacter sp. DSM 110680]|uniref:histidine kinase n=1 Tax=Telmatobacter sp. DSM 110680 TaxID=3036704 RepID=A0AAU7DL99_9BACT
MSLKTAKPVMHSAAWRISLWGTLAYAVGTMLVFVFLHQFVAADIQRRSDAWLSGEVEVLGDVAEHTPKDALYGRVMGEVAELASKEVPNRVRGESAANDSVFFLQMGTNGDTQLWAGPGSSDAFVAAIRKATIQPEVPTDVNVAGTAIPFRVATLSIDSGNRVYLGLSERDELRVLRKLRVRFISWWLLLVALGFAIVFYTTRRMLSHVRQITEAASGIGHSELNARVPTSARNDEVGQLGRTLNRMLDRIENSMHQLHTITDSLAHDLRSPLTAIRGKLEMSLSAATDAEQAEPIVSAIDELDRLTEFLNASLDVAEARADALRLSRSEINMDELLRIMIDLYEPSMAEKGLHVRLRSAGPVTIDADAALVHRMIANLFDNELKHLPASCTVTVRLESGDGVALLSLEDDGPGFSNDVSEHLFERRVKGRESNGHGLGLAFVDAVVRAHGGAVTATNREGGGARISLTLPLVAVHAV